MNDTTFSLERVLRIATENLMRMSRTANGIVDISASDTKKDAMLISGGDQTARKASENFSKAIRYCFKERHRNFQNAQEVRSFLETVAEIVNEGIVKPGQLIRSGRDTLMYNYARLADLPAEYDWFCEELYRLCSDPKTDTVWLAAFAEYYVNMRLHIFSDGCGKVSMVISAYMCMRSDRVPVSYESRDAYFRHDTSCIAHCGSPEDQADFARFYAYYKKLASRNELES